MLHFESSNDCQTLHDKSQGISYVKHMSKLSDLVDLRRLRLPRDLLVWVESLVQGRVDLHPHGRPGYRPDPVDEDVLVPRVTLAPAHQDGGQQGVEHAPGDVQDGDHGRGDDRGEDAREEERVVVGQEGRVGQVAGDQGQEAGARELCQEGLPQGHIDPGKGAGRNPG